MSRLWTWLAGGTEIPRLLQCLSCLTIEVLPDALGKPEAFDPLLAHLIVRHRGPLNREQLRTRPKNAPRLGEIRDELIACDMCGGGGSGCDYCEGTGKLQRWPHLLHDIFTVTPDDWASADRRAMICRQLWADHVGYPDEFYAAKDTYREDAGHCYRRHRNPGSENGPDGCIDYRTDGKRLTDGDWKARGERMGMPREDIWLCSFCAYQSVVMVRMRAKRGLYDE